jgi:hypothetical protein
MFDEHHFGFLDLQSKQTCKGVKDYFEITLLSGMLSKLFIT